MFRQLRSEHRIDGSFGTTVGLIAAVAGHGFDDLSARLRSPRDSGELSEQLLKDFAVAYAEFALRHPDMYRAMHAAELWHAQSGLDGRSPRANDNGVDKARTWIEGALGSRRAAFKEFERRPDCSGEDGVRADPQNTRAHPRICSRPSSMGSSFITSLGIWGAGNAIGACWPSWTCWWTGRSGLEAARRDPRPDWERQGKRLTIGTSANEPRVGEPRYHDALGPAIVVRPRLDGQMGVPKLDDGKNMPVERATLLEVRQDPEASAKTGRRKASAPARC